MDFTFLKPTEYETSPNSRFIPGCCKRNRYF